MIEQIADQAAPEASRILVVGYLRWQTYLIF